MYQPGDLVVEEYQTLEASLAASIGSEFPHIGARLKALEGDAPATAAYLSTLIFNDRQPPRRGFPPHVGIMILRLYNLVNSHVPINVDWAKA